MRARGLLILVLGLWLGASLAITAVVAYNLAGFADLFARNPALAEQAGFDPADTLARKQSLLWVHASEQNRVFFGAWNRTQLVLGTLALLAALRLALVERAAARPPPWLLFNLIAAALLLAALLHLAVEPQLVEIGRTLDFQPREPPPPNLAEFQRLHGIYSAVDLLRLLLLVAATLVALPPGARGRDGPSP